LDSRIANLNPQHTLEGPVLSSCTGHEFDHGVALVVPGSHQQNFAAEGIPEHIVDIGRAIDFKETRATGVCPVQTNVEQKAQLGKLLRRVFSKIFNHLR
jgi:hypothetical protein